MQLVVGWGVKKRAVTTMDIELNSTMERNKKKYKKRLCLKDWNG